ncbi:helix-hairpin-helix domain-containing protein [Tenacibaculum maritimum]|uniref:ComEA family DNA-binding protein n=1 Tax=Tenacibaculum maritimum TaxID=107401 RepID=UPI00388DA8C4
MKTLKSHFRHYNKRQRNGVFFLILIIVVLEVLYFSIDFSSGKLEEIDTRDLIAFQREIDSLREIEKEKRKPKKYSFNPSYITDFKAYKLGMKTEEVDRWLKFRKENQFVNSAKEFQKVTKIPDSLLRELAPLFKFPDWVLRKKRRALIRSKSTALRGKRIKNHLENSVVVKGLNDVVAMDLETVRGVERKIAERIIKYRKRLKGFTYASQLYEVWGLKKEIADKILEVFKIVTVPSIKKVNVNTATFKEVLKNPYVNYELCKRIFAYREEVAELEKISELKNIEGFPIEKYDRIILYLEAN